MPLLIPIAELEATSRSPQRIFEITKAREVQLSRMLVAYIAMGLFFMLLPGTFLGVWNLIAISSHRSFETISPAWIQAHGHAQVFGWIGSFILGIGYYSIPKLRRIDLHGGPNEDFWYTDEFSGTSSASPIVVGAVGCIQGILKSSGRPPRAPSNIRKVLRTTGSPQQDAPTRPKSQHIGNRPDLRQIVRSFVAGSAPRAKKKSKAS